VAYFPSLIAGPIDRPNDFIPQLHANREPKYENFVEGLKRFIWGWFMKICVADRMTTYITAATIGVDNGTTMFLVALMGPFRTYCDFAGYSHMAIGVSRMLGIISAENFNHPFFAQNISDYWRRWHMSLTQWVTDYVYTPLNFKYRKKGKWGMILAIYVNLFVISLWHKASWGYVLFGLYHATLFIPIILRNIQAKDLELKWIKGCILHPINTLKAAGVYLLVTFAGVLASAKSFTDIATVVKSWFGPWGMPNLHDTYNIKVFLVCGFVVIIKDYLDEMGAKYSILKSNKPIWVVIGLVVFTVLIFFLRGDAPQEFIYKQF
jgi:D-alanyl-lipoteichoic acid acyltransferase DltB (MBOAT superfamily)